MFNIYLKEVNIGRLARLSGIALNDMEVGQRIIKEQVAWIGLGPQLLFICFKVWHTTFHCFPVGAG